MASQHRQCRGVAGQRLVVAADPLQHQRPLGGDPGAHEAAGRGGCQVGLVEGRRHRAALEQDERQRHPGLGLDISRLGAYGGLHRGPAGGEGRRHLAQLLAAEGAGAQGHGLGGAVARGPCDVHGIGRRGHRRGRILGHQLQGFARQGQCGCPVVYQRCPFGLCLVHQPHRTEEPGP